VPCDDIDRHLSDSPRVVSGSADYGGDSPNLPGVEESAGAPNARPITRLPSFLSSQYLLGSWPGQRPEQRVVEATSSEQIDAARDDSGCTLPMALRTTLFCGVEPHMLAIQAV